MLASKGPRCGTVLFVFPLQSGGSEQREKNKKEERIEEELAVRTNQSNVNRKRTREKKDNNKKVK